MNNFQSNPNGVQTTNLSSYLRGSSVVVIGTSTIFLNSLYDHLSDQGANVAVFRNVSDMQNVNDIHSDDIVPPYELVVFEAMVNKEENIHKHIEQLNTTLVNPKILLVGDVATPPFAQLILSASVAGILTQQASALQVCGALSLISSGMYVIPAALLGIVDPRLSAEPFGRALNAILSPREDDVLAGLCQGESNKQIARRLEMAEPTVRAHVRSILVKLGASNRTQASIWAIRHGFGAATGKPFRSARQPESSAAN